jgi:hypothetical protein
MLIEGFLFETLLMFIKESAVMLLVSGSKEMKG